jgi:uncharacterized membrane protein
VEQQLPPETPRAAQENIHTVAELEAEFLRGRSASERLGDRVADFTGSMKFVAIHLVWFAIWILINLGFFPVIRPFDPFPFILLSLVVSCEAVLLSTFVLMKQNRMSKAADQRSHLNLQIDLLAEQEITKILQMLTPVCDRLGLRAARDPEVSELSNTTALGEIARELKDKLPAG